MFSTIEGVATLWLHGSGKKDRFAGKEGHHYRENIPQKRNNVMQIEQKCLKK